MKWEFRVSRCKLIYIYRMDKQQGPSIHTRNNIKYPGMNHNGKDPEGWDREGGGRRDLDGEHM